jgi:hypothetical protein
MHLTMLPNPIAKQRSKAWALHSGVGYHQKKYYLLRKFNDFTLNTILLLAESGMEV